MVTQIILWSKQGIMNINETTAQPLRPVPNFKSSVMKYENMYDYKTKKSDKAHILSAMFGATVVAAIAIAGIFLYRNNKSSVFCSLSPLQKTDLNNIFKRAIFNNPIHAL